MEKRRGPTGTMVSTAPTQFDGASAPTKRKLPSEEKHPALPKKQRIAIDLAGEQQTASPPSVQLHEPILAKLRPKYEVKTMSVMPSTSISKHVDKALEHLGRFSAWDKSVLPGVVLLYAKSGAASKLITISEVVRRRIAEGEQKWYQYNVLGETECAATQVEEKERSVIEETVLAAEGANTGKNEEEEDDGSDDDEYFETSKPTIHELAVDPPKVRHQAWMTIFLSRIPIEELKRTANVGLQTNEQHINLKARKRV
ncbi:hypothetical protein QBC46DRAFT_396395 [Diplogelasinospora grovesii]|uniref:DNA/RNA-binding protein Alba-like domain-containing protein n=1 Tax=Diplogelasinospora grovesii TaxID=303347 RepID=A0AAN6N1T9_9PEZI|nr:hypothetical protein QBC46DRAFT_396395 [Diplogelasinospora grovesii]